MTDTATSLPTLYDWTRDRIADYVNCTPEEIEPDRPLLAYGVDSVFALTFCGEVEDEFGLEIDPTFAWDYPTVDAIAAALHEKLAERS